MAASVAHSVNNNNNVKKKRSVGGEQTTAVDVCTMRKSPDTWGYADVAKWLTAIGFEQYSNLIAFQHKVNTVFSYASFLRKHCISNWHLIVPLFVVIANR